MSDISVNRKFKIKYNSKDLTYWIKIINNERKIVWIDNGIEQSCYLRNTDIENLSLNDLWYWIEPKKHCEKCLRKIC